MATSNIPKTVLFLVSPFLALPAILRGIYNKNSYNFLLLAILYGLMQYLYVPNETIDLSRHYIMFDRLNDTTWLGYLSILESNPDFIFYGLMFLFGKLGLSAQFLWMLICIFTIGSFFFLFIKLVDKNKISKGLYFLAFLVLIFAISYRQFFSGLRFYFGVSICAYGFWYGIFEEKRKRGLLLILAALFTHFSMIAFFMPYALLRFWPQKHSLYKFLFFSSFIFLLIPQSLILGLLNSIGITDLYSAKIDVYIRGEDVVERQFSQSEGYSVLILYLIKRYIWIFFSYLYLIATIKRKSLLRNVVYGILFIVNISFQFGFISYRYSFFLAILFSLLVTTEMIDYKKKKAFFILLGLFTMKSIVDLIVMRDLLIASYATIDISNIYSILSTHIGVKDFIE